MWHLFPKDFHPLQGKQWNKNHRRVFAPLHHNRPPLYTKAEDVKTWLESRDLDDPDEYDAGIVLKATGELIGSGGLFYKPENDLWTIGYNIRKDQWGNGYVPEAIRAIIEYVKTKRDVRGIQGTFANENHKSQRVMEKLGMTYAEDVTLHKLDGSASYPGKRYVRLYR